MSRIIGLSLAFVLSLTVATADEKAKPTVELRWAEGDVVKGVTEDKGVDLACSDKPAFLHKKAIATRSDLAWSKVRQAAGGGFIPCGLAMHFVEIHVREEAAKSLAASSEKNKGKPLVLLVDCKIVAAIVIMADLTDTVPILAEFTPETLQVFTNLLGPK